MVECLDIFILHVTKCGIAQYYIQYRIATIVSVLLFMQLSVLMLFNFHVKHHYCKHVQKRHLQCFAILYVNTYAIIIYALHNIANTCMYMYTHFPFSLSNTVDEKS